jgi:diguanylate cyclase (GGDEF)-like protein/PAS domain S-box-containing protein
MRDISDARKAEERLSQIQEALRNSEERHRIAFQASPNAVSIFRLDDGMYIDVNTTFLETMGFGRQEVVGRSSPDLNIWADPGDWQNLEETLRESGVFRGEVQFRKKNGEIYWGLMSASVFDHDGVSCVLSVTQDVSAAKAAQQEIRNLAFYDPLTTLPNRRLLEERLGQALAASALNHRNQALLFVDLDDFKTLNDTLGHQTGDLLLLEVAGRLSACVRESDTVARLGGDEFVVMLEELSEIPEDAAAQAEAIGKKILAAVGQPYRLDDHQCRSSASIGITVFGGQQKTAGEVLQHADIAMYQAKAAGRNTIRFFAPALQAAVHARAELEEELRDAIMANQFVLYYQPQVDRARLIGAEALIRWNHPRRGLLAPGEFISLAEETGLILPMGDWVLETACRQIAAWAQRKVAANISVAVNISARQFRQPGFVDQTLAIIGRTGANPGNLKLELTESMLVENVEDVIAKMVTLRSCGLRFSLDDFGTGYSSLAYLKRLPLDQLKIDRSFVRDILEDTGSCAIAQSVISLGKALGLTVVAEGVETVEQRDHLDRLGCHKHQGFLFGRPVSLEEFERTWLGCGACPAPGPGKRRRVAGNKLR